MENRKKRSAGQSGVDSNELIRNKTVKFLCSIEEHQRIKQLAEQSGQPTIAQFAREQALEEPGRQTKATLNALRKCQLELNRIGTNLNQISKFLNFDQQIDGAVYGALKDIKKMAYQILEEAKKAEWSEK